MSNIMNSIKSYFGPGGAPAQNYPTAPVQAAGNAKLTNLVSMRRPVQGGSEIFTLTVHSYEDGKEIASALRDGLSVIANIAGLSEPEQRNVHHFMLGVIAGVAGDIQRITPVVYLLTPHNVGIVQASDEEPEAFQTPGDDLISSPFAK